MINRYLIGVFFAITFLFGCSFPLVDYSQQEGYKQLINQKYRLKVDCFIVDYGSGLNIIPCGRVGLPETPDERFVGKVIKEGRVQGIVLKGSEFKITNIYYLDGFDAGGIIFHVKLTSQSGWDVLSTRFLQSAGASTPDNLNPEYVYKIP